MDGLPERMGHCIGWEIAVLSSHEDAKAKRREILG